MLRASFRHRTGAVLLLLLSTALLSACGGGAGHVVPLAPVAPPGGAPLGTSAAGNVIVTGTFAGNAPVLFASTHRKMRDRRTRNVALTFDHVEVDGTLFPGDAGAYPITNTIDIPAPSNGTYVASVPFSNAPVHPNEWAVLQFVGVAKDGSKVALGETGGLFNVSASATTSVSITAATTVTLQVFIDLIGTGAISTYDLDHATTLASDLTNDINATTVKVDTLTGLFDGPGLQTVYNAVVPKYERDVTLSASPATAKTFTIVRDYTAPEEQNILDDDSVFGLTGLYSLYVPNTVSGGVTGASGCGGVVVSTPQHTPAQFPIAPESVSACVLSSTNGTLSIRGIYGGPVILGATNDPLGTGQVAPASLVGGNLKIPGEPVGAFKSTVTATAAQEQYTVSDPVGFAFGAGAPFAGLGLFDLKPFISSGLYSGTRFDLSTGGSSVGVTHSPSYSATNDKITVETFNAWDLPTAYVSVCGGLTCHPINTGTTATLAFVRPFEDPGTNLAYFHWAPGGTLHSVTASMSGGYDLDFTAAGTGSMTTHVSTVFTPREQLDFANIFPNGSEIVITAIDTAGHSYSNGTILGGATQFVTMSSVYQDTTMQTVTIYFYVPAAGTYNFLSLTDTPGFGGV